MCVRALPSETPCAAAHNASLRPHTHTLRSAQGLHRSPCPQWLSDFAVPDSLPHERHWALELQDSGEQADGAHHEGGGRSGSDSAAANGDDARQRSAHARERWKRAIRYAKAVAMTKRFSSYYTSTRQDGSEKASVKMAEGDESAVQQARSRRPCAAAVCTRRAAESVLCSWDGAVVHGALCCVPRRVHSARSP